MYHDDEDLHMCITCHATIAGLENYISHRNAGPCKSQHSVKRSEAPIPVLSPLEISKSERIRPISTTNNNSSGENLNFLNADFFFSSLELQSRRKEGVFEEVMGIEEVLDEDYEVRDSGGPRTVYSSGGKWGYEDYATEREIWEGGGKGGEGLVGSDFHEDDVDLHIKSETFKEKSKKKKDKSLSICETEESTPRFDESLNTDVDYLMRNDAQTKSDILISTVKTSRTAEDMCLSDTNKESVIGEFSISLDNCNLVMDSLNSKEVEERYKNGRIPPSGHTRGKWIPGSASEGIRKSGNAVEYFCKPCNKNIRNRRSYEAHLSTTCHLKKLMKHSNGQCSITGSEGPRLRSRRILMSNLDPKSVKRKEDKLVDGESKPSEEKQGNSVCDSQSLLMHSLGVKRKVAEEQVSEKVYAPHENVSLSSNIKNKTRISGEKLSESKRKISAEVSEDYLDNIPLSLYLELLEKSDNYSQLSKKNIIENVTCKESNPKKSKYSRKSLKRSCKLDSASDGEEQAICIHNLKKRICPDEIVSTMSNLQARDEMAILSHKKSFSTIIKGKGIDDQSKKTRNDSVIDFISVRQPVVNLGYRCDSAEFQQEREKMKALDSQKLSNTSHQSSDKCLQDEMLFGLELMRTETNIPGDLRLKTFEREESVIQEFPSHSTGNINEKNNDMEKSKLPFSESDSCCNVVEECDAFIHGKITTEDDSIQSKEEKLIIQPKSRVPSEDNNTPSEISSPHINSESVNISLAHGNESINLGKRAVNDSSVMFESTIETQAALGEILVEENPQSSSRNLKEDGCVIDSCTISDNSKSQKISEVEYYVVIKSSFDDKSKESPVTLKNSEAANTPSINKVAHENIKVICPQVQSHADDSTGKLVMIVENVAKRGEGILKSHSFTVNKEVKSIEDGRRQELKEKILAVDIISSKIHRGNDEKYQSLNLRQGSPNVLNDFHVSNPNFNGLSPVKRVNGSQTIPLNFVGKEIPLRNVSCRTSKDSYLSKNQEDFLKVNNIIGEGKEVNLTHINGQHIGTLLFKQSIPASIQDAVNKFSFSAQNYFLQASNFIFPIAAGIETNSQLPEVNQNTLSKPPVEGKDNSLEIESKDMDEKNKVPTKRYRPLLPKPSIHVPPKTFGMVNNKISHNYPLPCGPVLIGGIPAVIPDSLTTPIPSQPVVIEDSPREIPLNLGNSLSDSPRNSQIGSTLEVSSIPSSIGSVPSEVINRNVEDVSSRIQCSTDAGESPYNVKIDQVGTGSGDRLAAHMPSELHRGENKNPCEGHKDTVEEDTSSDPVKYVCGICGYQSSRFWCVDRHIAKHLPRKKKYSCEVCELQFFSKNALKQHSKRHEPKKWSCNIPDCLQVFATKNERLAHVLGRHGKEKRHKCSLCEYSGKTSLALERHMKKHKEADRNVKCDICSKVVKKECLERHKKIHDVEEFYFCPHCDFKTNFLTNLRRHIKQSDSHPGKKLYSCPFCSSNGLGQHQSSLKEQYSTFSANSAHEMLEHLNTKHPEEKDFSFKYNTAGELVRRLLAFLGIYNPRKEVFEKDQNEKSPEKCNPASGSNRRLFEDANDIQQDHTTISCIGNEFPIQTSGASVYHKVDGTKFPKMNGSTNESMDVSIKSDKILNNMACSLQEKPPGSLGNAAKNRRKIEHTLGLSAEVVTFKENNSEVMHSQSIRTLNTPINSSKLPFAAKQKSSRAEYDKRSLLRVNNLKTREASISDIEKDPHQICRITNVFTMAESDMDLDTDLPGKNVPILKDANSLSDYVLTSSIKLSDDSRNLRSHSTNKETEVKNIDSMDDEVSSKIVKGSLLKDENIGVGRNSSNIKAPQVITDSSINSIEKISNLKCIVKSDSGDLSENLTSSPIRQKRKAPRWSSVVEIIEKRDGVISLWPTSP